jgi:hypothetical protein
VPELLTLIAAASRCRLRSQPAPRFDLDASLGIASALEVSALPAPVDLPLRSGESCPHVLDGWATR